MVIVSPALLAPALPVALRPVCWTSILSVSSDEAQAEHVRAYSNQRSAKVIQSSVSAPLNSALVLTLSESTQSFFFLTVAMVR